MPIELTCTGCGQMLRIGDEHAGKKARCPKCGAINQAPGPGISTSAPENPDNPFASSEGPPDKENPFSDTPTPSANPYVSPASGAQISPSAFSKAHRGGLILTLSILGILCCGPLGIVAWIMGAADLKEIESGRMDPSGRGLTKAGMIVGIIATVLFGLGIILQVVLTIAAG